MTPRRYILSMIADEIHILKTALDMGLTNVPESLMIRVNALADQARLKALVDEAEAESPPPLPPGESIKDAALRLYSEIHGSETAEYERAAAEKLDKEAT